MKETPVDHVKDAEKDVNEWPEVDDPNEDVEMAPQEKPRNLEQGMKKKWYDLLDYKKMVPLMPILKRVRGSKKNITIPIFSELHDSMQSVFERNKHFFRFRTQVDLMAYYWGAKVLEQIYLVHKGLPSSRLSRLLEAREKDYRKFDDMKTVKELFQQDLERFSEGFISQEEVHKNWKNYLDTFESEIDRKQMNDIMEMMLENGGVYKAKDRIRKRVEYNRSKFHLVDDN